MKTALYWTGSLFLIITLLLAIFGAAEFVMSHHWPFQQIWGVFFVLLGATCTVAGKTSSSGLWKQRWRGASSPSVGQDAIQISTITGMAFVVAGIAYALTGEVWVLIGALAVVTVYTRLFYAKSRSE